MYYWLRLSGQVRKPAEFGNNCLYYSNHLVTMVSSVVADLPSYILLNLKQPRSPRTCRCKASWLTHDADFQGL